MKRIVALIAASAITCASLARGEVVISKQPGHPTDEPLFSPKQLMSGSAHYTFIAPTTSSSIDFAELCYSANSNCSVCGPPMMTIRSGTAASYTTAGTTYGIRPAAIAAYLQSIGVSSGTYYIGLYVQSKTLDCASSASYCGSSGDSSSATLCMTAAYDGSSVTSLSQSDNGSVTLNVASTQFGYLSDSTTSSIYRCVLATGDGKFSSCTQLDRTATGSPTSWSPFAVDFSRRGTTQYAYVADNSNNRIIAYTVSSSGALTFFGTAGSTTNGNANYVAAPVGVTLATIGTTQYAYISGNTQSYLKKCTIDATALFTADSCAAQVASDMTDNSRAPWATAFATVNGVVYAYIAFTDGGSGYVRKCSVDSSGTLSACADETSASLGGGANGLTIGTYDSAQYLYVPTYSGIQDVLACSIGVAGALTCAAYGASKPWTGPRALSFATVNGTSYAYVSNQANVSGQAYKAVYTCTLNSGGSFNTCAPGVSMSSSWGRGLNFAYAR